MHIAGPRCAHRSDHQDRRGSRALGRKLRACGLLAKIDRKRWQCADHVQNRPRYGLLASGVVLTPAPHHPGAPRRLIWMRCAGEDLGTTALHLAASRDHSTCVELLLNAGADLHARDVAQWTPLMFAAYHGSSNSIPVRVPVCGCVCVLACVCVCVSPRVASGISYELRSCYPFPFHRCSCCVVEVLR